MLMMTLIIKIMLTIPYFQDVTLSCKGTGSPRPAIKWTRDPEVGLEDDDDDDHHHVNRNYGHDAEFCTKHASKDHNISGSQDAKCHNVSQCHNVSRCHNVSGSQDARWKELC